MRDEHPPLWQVGLRGLVEGAVGGFLTSALVLWLHNNDLWPLDTDFDWLRVLAFTLILGWLQCLIAILTERNRRKTAVKDVESKESDSAEHAATRKAP